ncbi:phosphoglycerate dehydrogenase [Faecalicoccus acidiformans]|uniref:phosphoglycerate dehydrogenase n=1 Tax=Faecalicoccus acidiformans TaxID=915173 RepID=UPI0025A44C35|nr:phosphoglycerate dehydrogenase [Faecalicoccus acidiformans]MDM8204153.1 phosphoglycerate dehydrogenase [Faecalicoccus acidiformans]
MYKIKLYNNIAPIGIQQFTADYEVGDDIENEDAILVRSANLHNIEYSDHLKCIARAGAGTNNIDIDACTQRGIVVFNTPGANSNAVKELVFAGMLLASRDIYGGISWAKTQQNNESLAKDMEKQKKKYAGTELNQKTLGVIGCGAIGVQVANLALRFGMKVRGYDPFMSIDAAWNLSRYVHHDSDIDDLFRNSDFITIHIPLNEKTKNTINKETIAQMKDGVKILNFARGGLVNNDDILEALNTGKVAKYVTDFPTPELVNHPNVIAIPHLGASTAESEENCAIKAAQETMHYLQYGNIRNSVNFPDCYMDFNAPFRICVIHHNVPKMISQITNSLSHDNANIENLMNKSRNEIAYTILDLDKEASPETIQKIEAIPGVVKARTYRRQPL